jgi:hypothetical protein
VYGVSFVVISPEYVNVPSTRLYPHAGAVTHCPFVGPDEVEEELEAKFDDIDDVETELDCVDV